MRKYRLVAKKGEGTFSEVLKAQNVKDGKYHAIKCMKNRFESIDQVNNLREIQALRRLSPHEHVITLEEVLYDQPTGRLALVFELMDANLYELIRGRRHYLNPQLIKSYIWQLMKALDHMHKKGIFHRDIKPENILIESSTDIGRGLKLADFGSCRGIYSKQPYTEYISTRWYRAPECLLTDGYYGPEMDLWGAGCVMFEITSLYPLFPGSNEVDQINRIHKVLGTPGQDVLQKFRSKGASHISFDFPPQKGIGIPQLIPHAAADGVDLMVKLLKYDATERITAREAMRHPYFRDIRETEARAATNVGQTAGGGSNDNQSVAGSVGMKSVASNKTGLSNGAGSVAPGQGVGQGKMGGQPINPNQPTTIAKALPSIAGSGALLDNPQMSMAKQNFHGSQGQHAVDQYQSGLLKPSQQIKPNATSGMGGVGASSLPPIGQQPLMQGQQGYQQQQQQMQQQQMQMQMQQQKLGQQQQQQQRMVGNVGQPTMTQGSGARAAEPTRRRKKYRMTYGQQQQQGQAAAYQQMQMQQQQQQLQQQQMAQGPGPALGNNAVGGGGGGGMDYRSTNKRAGQEQVMRAYGVKGMGAPAPQGPSMMMAGGGGGANQGSSYGGHPNRHYAPPKH